MLSPLATGGVEVDLTVEPGQRPQGPLGGERGRGLSPEYRGVPTEPYRSSPRMFPAPDPASDANPLLIPLFSAPGRRGRRSPVAAETSPRHFVPRLAFELLRKPPSVLALAVRSDAAAVDSRWARLAHNLEHLARHRRMRFVTATAAAEHIVGTDSQRAR
jgi:hypothetical protein